MNFKQTAALHLLGHLTEVADVSQHSALDHGVRQVLLLLLRVEVGMESVDALHGGGALLAVAKNQVNPQVEVGAHKVAFQGLGPGGGGMEGVLRETKTSKRSNITKVLNTHFARGSPYSVRRAGICVIKVGRPPSVKTLMPVWPETCTRTVGLLHYSG